MDIAKLWDLIVEYGVATEEELQLITSINGYSLEALVDVIYARTGYSIEQFLEDITGGF